MRFHILGLPHTVSSKEYVACAYTQKVVKFAKMMTDRGHTVIHYGHEESDLECTEHVTVTTNQDLEKAYGSYDWRKNFFTFNTGDHAYQTFYANAIREVGLRKQKNDFILPFWGSGVRPVCDAHPELITVEPGIGYAGGHWANYKIFESYAIMHAYYGIESVGMCKQNFYDIVIPNYFDPDDFTFSKNKQDHFLFLGRVYEGKGIHIAIQVTQAIGAKLIVAGQSNLEACGYKEIPSHVECVGYADVEMRKRLMSEAKGAFVASLYNEPFGGVQVECLFSGTPTITTDWGAFTENNINGVTGYRCRTFEEFCWAARNIDRIDPQACRDWALHNFSLEKVADMYEEFFSAVLNIHGGRGWYEPNDARTEMDYKTKHYPGVLAKIDYEQLAAEEAPFAARLANWIKDEINPTRVLDLGCGPGIYTHALVNLGIDAQGLDIDSRVDGQLHILRGDLLNLDGTETADLVMCLEVAEHIDPQYCDLIVQSVYNTIAPGGQLIWTAAQPGQGGVGHINNRKRSFWLDKFTAMGLISDAVEKDLIDYCQQGYHMGWFVNNVIVLKKNK
jgi:glycosyltransferase involved in cell wall biosynthesis/SAM-dependent methyltransferase